MAGRGAARCKCLASKLCLVLVRFLTETIDYREIKSYLIFKPLKGQDSAAVCIDRAGKGRTKAGDTPLAEWDWVDQREKLIRCLGSSSDVDLWKLFRPRNPDSRLLRKWLQVVRC